MYEGINDSVVIVYTFRVDQKQSNFRVEISHHPQIAE